MLIRSINAYIRRVDLKFILYSWTAARFFAKALVILMRVVVTGLGAVTPLGLGIDKSWKALLNGASGIVSLKDRPEYKGIPSQVAGLVPRGPRFEGKWDNDNWIDTSPNLKVDTRRTPLFARYALAATQEALKLAQWPPLQPNEPLYRTGVAVGSGIGGFDALVDNSRDFGEGNYRKVSPLFVPNLLNNMAAGHISIAYGLKGPNHSVSTACTTGAHAIGDAYNFIRLGMADVMVAGSTEASVHPLSVAGFARAKSLCTRYNDEPEKASRPFDQERSGFVISEGSGVMVLESLDHALKRKAPNIYAEIVGYGMSADAVHITAPSPEGDGAYRAMAMALGNIDPNEVGYVNAHATSTLLGDRAESIAIHKLLSSKACVSSTKGATGHLLGGAGSVEAIFTVLSLTTGKIPPTLNLESLEPDFPNCNFIRVQTEADDLKYALTNSFGFGGTNSSLLFKKWESTTTHHG